MPAEFYEKISFLLSNDDEYQRMKTNALKYAETQTWENVCGELYDIYREFGGKDL
jgi:glycosyltransferase involved in cell wall biosynthesis